MARFNLLEEDWIRVINIENGEIEEVSLIEVFQNAQSYYRLAGDMEIQNFAILRLLLSVLHTVFSRVDAEGKSYEYIDIDDQFLPINEIDSQDIEEYKEDLFQTWQDLWNEGEFPKVIADYLMIWHEHFYLFDDQYPFFQVTQSDLEDFETNKSDLKKPNFYGKNLNRTISESNNKLAFFSPKESSHKKDRNKDLLSPSEIARWLITFQGYIGTGDKVKFIIEEKKPTWSKGWLYDLGGLYLEGENLFETLLLNFAINYDITLNNDTISYQNPSWEHSGSEIITSRLNTGHVDNLAELYVNWGRAVYIDPAINLEQGFEMGIIKLLELNHQDAFIEPMTLWKKDKKGNHTPRKHKSNEHLWQSFHLLSYGNKEERLPGIIDWLKTVSPLTNNYKIKLTGITLVDDGNASSWSPTDEIYDTLYLGDYLLIDDSDGGWALRINHEVKTIKTAVSIVLGNFLRDINWVRNASHTGYIDSVIQEAYFAINQPFKDWLFSIELNDFKDEKIQEWRKTLYQLLIDIANQEIKNASNRDFLGRKTESEKYKNIATIYSTFKYRLRREVKING